MSGFDVRDLSKLPVTEYTTQELRSKIALLGDSHQHHLKSVESIGFELMTVVEELTNRRERGESY